MGATVTLNGHSLGTLTDQFMRYQFDVTSILSRTSNVLQVVFPKNYGIPTQGRFMACSGGWDWAPYSQTKDATGATTFSQGIWKDVYIVNTPNVLLTAVVPQIHWLGEYPTSPLPNSASTTAGFNVTVRAVFEQTSNRVVSGKLEVHGSWSRTAMVAKEINIPSSKGEHVEEISFPSAVKDVLLWWPNGNGEQHLYNLTITFTPSSGSPLTTSRRVGFRVFALVTADDSNPARLHGKTGSGNHTMKFRVNGMNLWSRGGNMIPMDNFEGRAEAGAFQRLVDSAKAGRFNTLRVWGGGMFYYNAFYDACDEAGLLLYHDMMYAQGGHSPTANSIQRAEIIHQVRRLSHHASIAIWDGCNECGGQGVYSSFVVTTVASVDQSRPVWPSCPSSGWVSGVDTLYGLPNGKPLIPVSNAASTDEIFKNQHLGLGQIEEHGPYKHGSGWPAVNGDPHIRWFPANVPPALPDFPAATGPYRAGYYASEFGCVGFSSFASMQSTLSSHNWGLHAKPLYQRNYPCDNIIKVYFGINQNLDPIGKEAFAKQLYQCMIGQMLELKSDIEVRRAGNTFGTVTWQLNEIWPTGGWGSVEYGTVNFTSGQILGGRWKPLQYTFRQSSFQDIFATCGANAFCFVKNDSPFKQDVIVTVDLLHLTTGKRFRSFTERTALEAGAGISRWFCANKNCNNLPQVLGQAGCVSTGRDCIFDITVSHANNNEVIMSNIVAITNPGNMTLNQVTISHTVSQVQGNSVHVQLSVNGGVAMYVFLTTAVGGTWSDNVLVLVPGEPVTLTYHFFGTPNRQAFIESLTIEHVKLYQ
eukprot:TRINITY_DN11638_c0_g1_i1.p1 TRINITY_DN11638_c0_g1~~TRINITY_DN11638_c0_g1_i1.p1  ORF type:complete len:932 (+),score=184.72 TRINITY_DN11638_c0_g1_i1:367-2796(+)